ncbi:hypothetical protein RHGRI_031534 [Rhododendron griersonianum]|uniref:Uncharacterized protein n=1 Tax=Rhododendron griersonianum TaxID=479676 RepID=A0AAV6IC12_9ERIC|nr:hypothetical protein RHGRI_031534 [Rhododendron griersonianum]
MEKILSLEFFRFASAVTFPLMWRGVKLKGLIDAAENYHNILAENRKLYNEVQDLKAFVQLLVCHYCPVSAAANVMGSNATTVQFLLLLLVSVRSISAAANAITVQFRSYVMELVCLLLFCYGCCSVRIGACYGQ